MYAGFLNCSQLAKDVADGVLSYDAQLGALCLDQISKYSCDQADEPSACKTAVVGRIASGGSCASGLNTTMFDDCAPGNYCDFALATCGGTCKAYAQVGSSCAYTSANGSVTCADGSSCQLSTDVCVADVTEGQPCEGPTAGNCADAFYCEGGSTTASGVCRKRKTSGACLDAGECASNHYCTGAAGNKTCGKAKLPGESCTPGQCYPLLAWCGGDGKCTDTHAKENQPCGSTTGDYIRCEEGLTCNQTAAGSSAGTCQKKGTKPAGSPCTSSVECAGTVSYCDPTTDLCVGCD